MEFEELRKIREDISSVFDNNHAMFLKDLLNGFAGIKLVKGGVSDLNCLSFVLGSNEFLDRNIAYSLRKISEEVTKPSKGDIVWYYGNGKPSHFAKYENEGIVISQWGEIGIFKHPEMHIPPIYGNPKFYTKSPSQEEIDKLIKQL